MIDFKNGALFKLKPADNSAYAALLSPLMVSGEEIVSSFQAMRDGIVFTNKRIMAINVQGMTGKKKDISSLPYARIQAFSVESAGVLDLDSELELWFSGLGKVKLEFTAKANVTELCRMISEYALA